MSATGAERRRPSYAVVWRAGEAELCCGKLELDEDALVLSGVRAPRGLIIPFDDVASVWVGRRPGDRIGGVTSLVVERRNGERLLAYVVGSVGALGELRELLSQLVGMS